MLVLMPALDALVCTRTPSQTAHDPEEYTVNIEQRSSEDYDRIIHRVMYGADAPGADSPPAYSDDEEVILEAIRTVFGQVGLTWKNELGRQTAPPSSVVCLVGTGRQSECWGQSPALALCHAAIRLAVLRAPRQARVDVAPGFYWFRPTPYQPVFPIDVSDGRACCSTHYPFVFISDEPMPVFVHEVEGRWLVAGMANPIDWPRTPLNQGWSEIPLEDLPGELGPRLMPPAAWGTELRPERLIVEPVQPCRDEEPEHEFVDVWTGEKVEQADAVDSGDAGTTK